MQGSHRGCRIVALVIAQQRDVGGERREVSVGRLNANARPNFGPEPVSANFLEVRPESCRFAFDDQACLVDLRRQDARAARPQNACLMPGDLGQRLAQRRRVVVANRCDH